MSRRRPTYASSLPSEMDGMRSDYDAAKRTSRFQPRRRGVPAMGAGADYHYRSESDYLWIGEIARELYRNDAVMGQLTDRAVVNTISSGFKPDPNTGDKGLDRELKDRFEEESLDPDYCDAAGEQTFYEQETTALRETLVAGDVFGLPQQDGTVQFQENHRCRSPQGTKRKNLVHGVQMEKATRKRTAFYFTNEPIDPLGQVKANQLTRVGARDADGEANVWQIYSPKRFSQTRGVSAYAPIIVPAGMFGDLNFATLLKAQLSAFWLLVRNRDKSFFETNQNIQQLGVTSEAFTATRSVSELPPGSEIAAGAGETIAPWSPNIPNPEFFPHAKLILTLLGINLGMPLCLLLLDASETNFSGFRGAIDQARMGFRHNQRILESRFHRPWWRFKLNTWADKDPALAARREELEAVFFRHKWHKSGWPYIEPTKDAQADLVRAANMQSSHRRIAAERGMEWGDIVTEMVEDRKLAIVTAVQAAKEINSTHQLEPGDVVSWRDLAPLPLNDRLSVFLGEAGETAEPAAKPAGKKPAGGKAMAVHERPGQVAIEGDGQPIIINLPKIEIPSVVVQAQCEPSVINVAAPILPTPIVHVDPVIHVEPPVIPPTVVNVAAPIVNVPPAAFDIEPVRDPNTKLVTRFKRVLKEN